MLHSRRILFSLWLHLDLLLPKQLDFGDFDSLAPEVVTKHPVPGDSETITLPASSSGLPSSVFLSIVLSIFMGNNNNNNNNNNNSNNNFIYSRIKSICTNKL